MSPEETLDPHSVKQFQNLISDNCLAENGFTGFSNTLPLSICYCMFMLEGSDYHDI